MSEQEREYRNDLLLKFNHLHLIVNLKFMYKDNLSEKQYRNLIDSVLDDIIFIQRQLGLRQ